ncbi:hypothetical protein [Micromonospora kangleipakensis]|uniref:hypothetical protein n=1 Tax=Micromonospora kangleipakensis TaxID=1077942 RepID=UPI001029E64C|nr:hypothetical protein [Micromonospora kangleipakensis]
MSVTDHASSTSPGRPRGGGTHGRHDRSRRDIRATEAAVAPMDAGPGGTTMISVAVTDGRPWIAVESVA